MGHAALAAFIALATIATAPVGVDAHPICVFGDTNPILDYESPVGFCDTSYEDGFCCDLAEETDVLSAFESSDVTGDCAEYHQQVLCGVCHPYSGHLYEVLGLPDGLTMTIDFCDAYVAACAGQLEFAADYCTTHTLGGDVDPYWSYPLTIENEFDSTTFTKAFPNLGTAQLPELPIFMEMTPDGKFWWIAGLAGTIIQVSADDPSDVDATIIQFVEITSSAESGFVVSKEEGILAFAISPGYTGVGSPFYVSYSYYNADEPGEKTEKQSNRLSKFIYTGVVADTLASEEIVLESTPKATSIHAGGWCGFKPSAKYEDNAYDDLYWAMGDGGPQQDILMNAQNLDTLHGKIMRVSVPRSGTGYEIPEGNVVGGHPAICTYGHRNVFRCGFDRANDDLYCGEIGHTRIEEINLIECGNFYGWNRWEGDICHRDNEFENAELGSCEDADRSSFQSPFFQYCHNDYDSSTDDTVYTGGIDICGDRIVKGLAVMGGLVYRGSKYADLLEGKYVFSDYQFSNLHFLTDESGVLSAGTIFESGSAPSIVDFAEDLEGEVYIVEYNGDIYNLPCGSLCSSSCLVEGSPPEYTAVGCYQDSKGNRVLQTQAPTCAADNAMSANICAAYCSTVEGSTHFGVQYASQCWCGSTDVTGLTPSDGCTTVCLGNPDQTCGGYSALELYEINDDVEPPSPAPPGSEFLGCFADEGGAGRLLVQGPADPSMSITVCFEFCAATSDNAYFALQYSTECWCGSAASDPTSYGESDGCNMVCGDGAGTCGGLYAMTLFQYTYYTASDTSSIASTTSITSAKKSTASTTSSTAELIVAEVDGATYLGCYGDGKTRVMDFGEYSTALSPEVCFDICEGFDYFGVEYGSECYCGNEDIDVAVYGAAMCDSPCSGDGSLVCGGTYALTTYQYTYSPSPTPSSDDGYLGCYADEKNDRILTLSKDGPFATLTPAMCREWCSEKDDARYYGLQYGVQCWCGGEDDDVTRHGAGTCDIPCGGSDDSCGGYNAVDVYSVTTATTTTAPPDDDYTELGCFADVKKGRIFSGGKSTSSINSVETCLAHCKENATGSLFGLQYSEECWCSNQGDDHEKYGPSTCDMECPSEPSKTCGGYDAMMVYSM